MAFSWDSWTSFGFCEIHSALLVFSMVCSWNISISRVQETVNNNSCSPNVLGVCETFTGGESSKASPSKLDSKWPNGRVNCLGYRNNGISSRRIEQMITERSPELREEWSVSTKWRRFYARNMHRFKIESVSLETSFFSLYLFEERVHVTLEVEKHTQSITLHIKAIFEGESLNLSTNRVTS
jgi:hypothetical protein